MHIDRTKKLLAVNLLTTCGVLLALTAIMLAHQGQFATSFALALVGLACDMLDGPLARHFGATSRFGAAYDAFADSMLYLLYPATGWYVFFPTHDASVLIVLFLFLACGLFRLARTAKHGVRHNGARSFFIGFPVVLSLPLLAGSFLLAHADPQWVGYYFFVLLPLFSLLMVSRIPFPKPAGRSMLFIVLLILFAALKILVL